MSFTLEFDNNTIILEDSGKIFTFSSDDIYSEGEIIDFGERVFNPEKFYSFFLDDWDKTACLNYLRLLNSDDYFLKELRCLEKKLPERF
jgi:hypothetical protein